MTQIGPYRIEGLLGRGGMGAVYRAQAPDGRLVALKTLELLKGARQIERFEREARVRFDHPNVVEVLGSGTSEDGTPFLALELLEGQSLAARLAHGRVSTGQAIGLASQALAGLEAVHARGVIHRDIKPANLFLCQDGRLKLLDFGIALFDNDDDVRLTRTGEYVGTPAYLSPEQACGDRDVDERADLWGVGVVLFELLSGESPFRRGTLTATLLAIVREEPSRLCELVPECPRELERIVSRAIAKSPHDRWKTAASFRAALLSIDITIVGAPPPPPKSAAPPKDRVVAILLAEGVRDAGALSHAIMSHRGVVVQLLGRRVIGLFGDAAWEGDELVGAAEAALEARPHAASVAVVSGWASVGSGRVSGDVLSRAEAACKEGLGGVVIDTDSARALGGSFELRAHRESWAELIASQPGDSDPTSPGSSRELLAREAEIAQLDAAAERAFGEGRALTVRIDAAMGMGKSALLENAASRLARAPSRRATLVLARAEPFRQSSAHALVASLIRGCLRALGLGLPPRDALKAVLAGSAPSLSDQDATLAFLAELLDAPAPEAVSVSAARRDHRLMADRIRLAVLDFFDAVSAKGPLGLFVDDLEWADKTSLELLEELADSMAQRPFLLVVTARSELAERRPAFFQSPGVVVVKPLGLSIPHVSQLARRILGRAMDPELCRRLTEHSAGVPFFIEQILFGLAAAPAGTSAETLPVPATVEAALQSRFDHLNAAEQEALRRAAVLARPFTSSELMVLGDAGGLDLIAALDALVARDLFEAHRVPRRGVREYRPRSRLLEEVAYRLTLLAERQRMHQARVRDMEERADPDSEELGRHLEAAGAAPAAAGHYAQAARRAAERGDGSSVLRCSDRALSLGLPAQAELTLRIVRAEALRFLGQKSAQVAELERAEALSQQDRDRAWVLAEQAWVAAGEGKVDRALTTADQAATAARRSGDNEALIRALGARVQALVYAGRLVPARASLDEAQGVVDTASLHALAIIAGWRAQIATARGDLGERREAFEQAAELYHVAGDVRRAAAARTNLADVYNRVGAYDRAEAALRPALEECRRVGYRLMQGYAALNLGYARALGGRTLQASAALDDAAALAKSTGDARLGLLVRIYQLRFLRGASPEASAKAADLAAAEAEAQKMPAFAALAHAVAASAWLSVPDLARADRASAQALGIRDSISGMEEDEAEVFQVRAQVLAALGQHAEATRVSARGRARVRELSQMISDPALRASFLESVPAHRALLAE